MGNRKIHTSTETRKYLETIPDKFEFIFTPKHVSWLNIIERFFSKMVRSVLRGIRRGIRVDSINELKERISQYIDNINEKPIVVYGNIKLKKETKCLAEL